MIDIDPSEEGRTGGKRLTPDAKTRRLAMRHDAGLVRERLAQLGVHVVGNLKQWFTAHYLESTQDELDTLVLGFRAAA